MRACMQALMRQWRPGATVSGIRIANGKRLWITIRPDGSTEEREQTEAELREPFMSVTHVEEVAADGTPLAPSSPKLLA